MDYVRERNPVSFEPQYPDADASYADRRTIDLSMIETLVALPDAMIGNSVPVRDVVGERIDQAFIGSCANGNLDDLAIAAKVVAGHRVAPGVRFLVTPGSQAIYRQALKAGYIETLLDAGAVVTPATCGACGGGHMGVLGANETCITASTRNFKGRMGDPSARIFMGSPATVAASAIAGVITHPGEYMKEANQ
jgi:3-isopropylmalate/(R)-2-methylmalate dehydratase large subunit